MLQKQSMKGLEKGKKKEFLAVLRFLPEASNSVS